MFRIFTIFLLLAFPSLLHAQLEEVEPEPFRHEISELEGRNFDYGKQGLLDRFSYRFDPSIRRISEQQGEGFRLTGGSVTSNEMYVVSHLEKRWLFSDHIFGNIRVRQDEDFDGDFSRILYGGGVYLAPEWAFAILSDIERDKENIDLQCELTWKPAQSENSLFGKTRVRLAAILVDVVYNGKGMEGRYEKKPYTFFLESIYASSPFASHIWINVNPSLEFYQNDKDSTYTYQQMTGGIKNELRLGSSETLLFGVKGQSGERSLSAQNFADPLERSFNRDVLISDLELRFALQKQRELWAGLHQVHFIEDSRQFLSEFEDSEITRDELAFFTGIRLPLSSQVSFRPTMYLNYIDLKSDSTSIKPSLVKNDHEITGRILFPFEYHFPKRDAILTINPTLEWPGSPFGGLNVQFQFAM